MAGTDHHVIDKYVSDILASEAITRTGSVDKVSILRLPQKHIIVFALQTESHKAPASLLEPDAKEEVFSGREMVSCEFDSRCHVYTNLLAASREVEKELSLLIADNLRHYSEQREGEAVNIGISRVYDGHNMIALAEQEARYALEERFFHEPGSIVHIEDACGFQLTETSNRLMSCIEAADAEGAGQCLGAYFQTIRVKTRATLALKKLLAANLLVQAYSFLCELEGPVRTEEIQTIFAADERIKSAASEEEIRAAVHRYISDVLDYLRTVRFRRYETMISRATGYVKTNYMKNIGTAEAAEYVGLDPDYFGNLFHKYAGTTFVRFLAEFRVSAAQEMLRSPDTRIADISQRCGFTDPKYFARVFKSMTGETPTQCRSRLSV